MTRKKPITPEEVEADIASHPERGMFKTDDGRLVSAVRTDTVEVRGDVPHEAYEVLLEIWGAKGLSKSDGVKDMINAYISDFGNLYLVEHKERLKSEVYGATPREVRSKVKGFYKARGRERTARLNKEETKD